MIYNCFSVCIINTNSDKSVAVIVVIIIIIHVYFGQQSIKKHTGKKTRTGRKIKK